MARARGALARAWGPGVAARGARGALRRRGCGVSYDSAIFRENFDAGASATWISSVAATVSASFRATRPFIVMRPASSMRRRVWRLAAGKWRARNSRTLAGEPGAGEVGDDTGTARRGPN